MTERRLVRAVLVGFNQPLDVPKKAATYRSLVRGFLFETILPGRSFTRRTWKKVYVLITIAYFLPAADDQDGVVIISRIE